MSVSVSLPAGTQACFHENFFFFLPLWPSCETNGSVEGFGKQRRTVLLQNLTLRRVGPGERLHMFPFPVSRRDNVLSSRISGTLFLKQSAAQILGDSRTDTRQSLQSHLEHSAPPVGNERVQAQWTQWKLMSSPNIDALPSSLSLGWRRWCQSQHAAPTVS